MAKADDGLTQILSSMRAIERITGKPASVDALESYMRARQEEKEAIVDEIAKALTTGDFTLFDALTDELSKQFSVEKCREIIIKAQFRSKQVNRFKPI